MTYRIAMQFDAARRIWIVTGCYEGRGPVPMVRRYRDGSKELILSAKTQAVIGGGISPMLVLLEWQRRPVRQRRIAESRAARATSVRPADLKPGEVWRDPKTPGLRHVLQAEESPSLCNLSLWNSDSSLT